MFGIADLGAFSVTFLMRLASSGPDIWLMFTLAFGRPSLRD